MTDNNQIKTDTEFSAQDQPFQICTQRLAIYPLHSMFTEQYWAYHKTNYKDFKQFLPYSGPDMPDYEDIETIVDNELKMMQANRGIRFLAFTREDKSCKTVVGDFFLYNIIFGYSMSAHAAFSLDRKFRGKGYMTEISRTLIDYTFTSLGLHRIELNIQKNNSASIRLAERLGFGFEGTARELLLINGTWKDMERYSCISTNWDKHLAEDELKR